MTAFADYTDLRAAVVEAVRDTSITDVFPRLTKLAEARMNRDLRLADMVSQATLVVSGGSAALPADFLEMFGVYDGYGREYIERPLQSVQGTHRSFYAINGATIVANDGTYSAHYYAALPTLTASATTSNAVLQKYPEAYLYAVAAEAAKHARSEDLSLIEQYRNEAFSDATRDDRRRRHSRARVRVGGVTP